MNKKFILIITLLTFQSNYSMHQRLMPATIKEYAKMIVDKIVDGVFEEEISKLTDQELKKVIEKLKLEYDENTFISNLKKDTIACAFFSLIGYLRGDNFIIYGPAAYMVLTMLGRGRQKFFISRELIIANKKLKNLQSQKR
ncbi:hypothetical protein M1446_00435 [Candidatus Dependentiae bacterium]|nr:hypothetical protein [Candidatus Dependentiae bacterium]